MGIHIIKMPDIGEGIAEVELVQWHVQPGDQVVEDQLLADVMTDKATVEVPSPVIGTVISLGGQVGEIMAVGAELIRLDIQEPEGSGDTNAPSTPSSAVEASDSDMDADLSPNPATASLTHVIDEPEKPLASPAVRRRAWDQGIELRDVPGTGTGGRVTHKDLDAFRSTDTAQAPPAARESAYAARTDTQEIPVIGLRRKIAQKMQESKRRIPHFSYVEEIDVTELETLRARLNGQWGKERGKLTLLPLLVRAMVLALRQFPQINARFDDEKGVVTQYGAVHMGVAAQTEAGLMVPVLHHAETLDLWACASEIVRLVEAARTGEASREELSGSTITVTSLGPLGGIVSTPVINHPEVAIVGVNRIVERPVILGAAVVARKMMNLSSSFDHRVVDGMHAAQFVQSIRAYLECPALLFIE